MSGRITDLMVGGMGTLGNAIGQGVEAVRTEQDWRNLQSANPDTQEQDPFVERIMALARQGVDPMQAANIIRQERSAAPKPQVPGLNQGNVVMNAVPVQAANGLGGLGAPPAAPSTPAEPVPTPGARQVALPGMEKYPRPASMPPLQETFTDQPPQRQPLQAQQAPAPAQKPQAAPQNPSFGGIRGEITPRNLPLAQFLAQRKGAGQAGQLQSATQLASEAIKGQQGMAKEQFKADAAMNREQFKAEARSNVVSAQLAAKLQQFDVQNQTDIWQTWMGLKAKMAAIEQSGKNSERRDSMLKAIYQESVRYASKVAPFRGMDPAIDATLDEVESIKRGIELSQGVVTTPGPEQVTPAVPGTKLPIVGEVGGTPEKRTPGKPKTTVGADRRKALGLE